ncbi:MAG: hypothetical protein AB7S93_07365, partial [Xanthobacteraceae bacterium]
RHAFGAIEWLNSQSQRWPTAMLFLLALGIIFLLALFGNGGSADCPEAYQDLRRLSFPKIAFARNDGAICSGPA